MNIRPIRTEQDHQSALDRVDELWGAEIGSVEGDELDVLVTLIVAFETKQYPMAQPDPVEAIKFMMEQQGLTPGDMVRYLGKSSQVADILNRKRKLTLSMIRNLHQGLQIPLESLIADYPLSMPSRTTAARR
ncbi:helix-turn-helix domain-containing protein [Vibrio parahaemolyticus]|jgi:HTH-type transcriptional regulator/antitoxin HigA